MTPASSRGKPFGAANVAAPKPFCRLDAGLVRRGGTSATSKRVRDYGRLFSNRMPDQSSTALFPEMREATDRNARSKTAAPLADRMRPRTLSEFVGQEQLVGEGRVLRRLIEGGATMPSLILWGPPGTGKTTLARLLAEKADARFIAISAVFSGVKDLRGAIADARLNRQRGHRTILFIDEIHRFNKAQQDALLPAV